MSYIISPPTLMPALSTERQNGACWSGSRKATPIIGLRGSKCANCWQSIEQWCEENNCGEGKYYYWLKQVHQEMLEQGSASTVALVQFEPECLPVAATETPTQKSPIQAADNILIHYGKACVELPKTTVATDVAQLLRLLCHD